MELLKVKLEILHPVKPQDNISLALVKDGKTLHYLAANEKLETDSGLIFGVYNKTLYPEGTLTNDAIQTLGQSELSIDNDFLEFVSLGTSYIIRRKAGVDIPANTYPINAIANVSNFVSKNENEVETMADVTFSITVVDTETANFDNMTKKELQAELTTRNIEFDEKATKSQLIKLIEGWLIWII